jgi:hypothetical protein
MDAPEECTAPDCERDAAVRLHVPWDSNRVVCLAHARSEGQKDGIVAEALENADEELP